VQDFFRQCRKTAEHEIQLAALTFFLFLDVGCAGHTRKTWWIASGKTVVGTRGDFIFFPTLVPFAFSLDIVANRLVGFVGSTVFGFAHLCISAGTKFRAK
jgi:hypothetical protein